MIVALERCTDTADTLSGQGGESAADFPDDELSFLRQATSPVVAPPSVISAAAPDRIAATGKRRPLRWLSVAAGAAALTLIAAAIFLLAGQRQPAEQPQPQLPAVAALPAKLPTSPLDGNISQPSRGTPSPSASRAAVRTPLVGNLRPVIAENTGGGIPTAATSPPPAPAAPPPPAAAALSPSSPAPSNLVAAPSTIAGATAKSDGSPPQPAAKLISTKQPVPDDTALAAATAKADEQFKADYEQARTASARSALAATYAPANNADQRRPGRPICAAACRGEPRRTGRRRAHGLGDRRSHRPALRGRRSRDEGRDVRTQPKAAKTTAQHAVLLDRILTVTDEAIDQGSFEAAKVLLKLATSELAHFRNKELVLQIKGIGLQLDDVAQGFPELKGERRWPTTRKMRRPMRPWAGSCASAKGIGEQACRCWHAETPTRWPSWPAAN